MNKNQLIFLSATVIMLKENECFKDMVNPNGKEKFKKAFILYHQLLSKLYDTIPDSDQKK